MEIKSYPLVSTLSTLSQQEASAECMCSSPPKSYRCKLYDIMEGGTWQLTARGEVSVVVEKEKYLLQVLENCEGKILNFLIDQKNEYINDPECLIYWINSDTGQEKALSFNSREETLVIWNALNSAIQSIYHNSKFAFKGPLAEPTFENLGLISEQISKYRHSDSKRRLMISQILDHDALYLSQLFKIFEQAETNNSSSKLTLIFYAIKEMVNICDERIITKLLCDKFFMSTLGALEYDSEVNIYLSLNCYRRFLKNQLNFNNPIEIEDTLVLEQIHLAYRLYYFKDTVAARWLEEAAIDLLSGMLSCVENEILSYIFQFKEAVPRIIEGLSSESLMRKLQNTQLLYELFSVSKFFQSEGKINFCVNLVDNGILPIITCLLSERTNRTQPPNEIASDKEILRLSDLELGAFSKMHSLCVIQKEEVVFKDTGGNAIEQLRVWLAEILTFLIYVIPIKIKERVSCVTEQVAGYPILNNLSYILTTFPFDSLKFEIIEFLKNLLDPTPLELSNELIGIFYDKFISRLVDPLKVSQIHHSTKYLILELLAHFAKVHVAYMQEYTINSGFLPQVIQLLHHKQKRIQMATLRLIQILLNESDSKLRLYFVESGALICLIKIIKASLRSKKDNAIRSAYRALEGVIHKQNLGEYWNQLTLTQTPTSSSKKITFDTKAPYILSNDSGTSLGKECKDSSCSQFEKKGKNNADTSFHSFLLIERKRISPD